MKTTIDLEDGVDATISAEIQYKRKEPFCPFIMLGRKGYSKISNEVKTMDLVDELLVMTKPEKYLFAEIKANLDIDSNIGVLRGKNYTTAEKQRLIKGYKLLRAKDIVRRAMREHYMYNPELVIPRENRTNLYKYYIGLK